MTSAPSPALPRRLHAQRALAVLQQVATGRQPADQCLDVLFREHREMGKRDRASVTTLVYGVLRDVLRLQGLTGDAPAGWLARHLADAGHAPEAIIGLELPAPAADGTVPDHATHKLPSDWYQRLLAQNGAAHTHALAAALALEAPIDLRVNTLKASREAAIALLAAEGIAAQATPLAAHGLRLSKRLSHSVGLLRDGLAEPQDEGSQLLAQMVAASTGETVVDYCAGAGGKCLALAASMGNQGRLMACDINDRRLAKIAPRAKRAGVDIIETRVLGAPQAMADLVGKAHAVLIDAPCSGSGTLRRSPELRLKPANIPALALLQAQIIRDASLLVRPGGRLVYATCSLFEEENEQIVADFLAEHDEFTRDGTAGAERLPLMQANGSLRLWPQLHGTDGFYACALTRLSDRVE